MDIVTLRRSILQNEGHLPPMYVEYDWLETPYNSAGYAYIDTGVAGNNNDLKLIFDYMALERRSYGRIIGSWNSEDNTCWRLLQYSGTTETVYYLFTANNRKAGSSYSIQAAPTGGSIVGYKAHIELEYGKCTTPIATKTAPDDGSAVSDRTISIGTRYPGDTSNGCAKGRFYRFRIYDSSSLIRDYHPCIRLKDNKAGFYDIINHTFNPSLSTIDFIAGND